MFNRTLGLSLKLLQDSLRTPALLLIVQVIVARLEEKPDAMGEEKVHIAGLEQNLFNSVDFDASQFGIQVEAAELRDEIFQVSPRGFRSSSVLEVGIESDAHKQTRGVLLVSVQLYKRIEHYTILESFFLQNL